MEPMAKKEKIEVDVEKELARVDDTGQPPAKKAGIKEEEA